MKMNPMSLYESGDSTGDVSIEEMFSGNVNCKYIRKVELDELAKLIIRGGWPENIDKEGDDIEKTRAAVIRTSRKLFEGTVCVPEYVLVEEL